MSENWIQIKTGGTTLMAVLAHREIEDLGVVIVVVGGDVVGERRLPAEAVIETIAAGAAADWEQLSQDEVDKILKRSDE